MEVKFSKKQMRCLRPIMRQVHSQEQTMEVRIPDAYPDIGKVLGCWGQPVIRGKEWRYNGISANGGVMCWVLYAPEDGTQPRVVDAWIPFQCRWDFTENTDNGTIILRPILSNMDGRSISARKMMLRAEIETMAQAMEAVNLELAEPKDVPEDIQLLKTRYPVDLPVEAGEKQVQLEEKLQLPAGNPPVHKIVRYTLNPAVTEQKVLSNRMVFRGVAELQLLYLTEEGQLHTWSTEIPFSQYTDLDKEYDQNAKAWVLPIVTALEMDIAEDGNLQLHAGIAAQYLIFGNTIFEIVEDAYSPKREVTPQFEELKIPILLDGGTVELQAEATKPGMFDRIISIDSQASFPKRNGMGIDLNGNFQMLYQGEDGQLQGDMIGFQSDAPYLSDNDNDTELWLGPGSQPEYMPDTDGMRLTCRYFVTTHVYSGKPITFVSGLELGEFRETDANHPSIILRRAGEEGLWSIAKRSGSTMDAIRDVNHLSSEPEKGQMLLIPVL